MRKEIWDPKDVKTMVDKVKNLRSLYWSQLKIKKFIYKKNYTYMKYLFVLTNFRFFDWVQIGVW
jgi:hypothetical protein